MTILTDQLGQQFVVSSTPNGDTKLTLINHVKGKSNG